MKKKDEKETPRDTQKEQERFVCLINDEIYASQYKSKMKKILSHKIIWFFISQYITNFFTMTWIFPCVGQGKKQVDSLS